MRAMTGKRTVIIKICFGALWGGGGLEDIVMFKQQIVVFVF